MARIELKAVATMTFGGMKGFSYRGFLPYATFGSRENSHKPNIAHLANAIFG